MSFKSKWMFPLFINLGTLQSFLNLKTHLLSYSITESLYDTCFSQHLPHQRAFTSGRQKHSDLHTLAKIFRFSEIAVATFGPSLSFLYLLFLWLSKFSAHSCCWGSGEWLGCLSVLMELSRQILKLDIRELEFCETTNGMYRRPMRSFVCCKSESHLWHISFCVSNPNLITSVGCWFICYTQE